MLSEVESYHHRMVGPHGFGPKCSLFLVLDEAQVAAQKPRPMEANGGLRFTNGIMRGCRSVYKGAGQRC